MALGLRPEGGREILGSFVLDGRGKRPERGGGAEGSRASGWGEGEGLCDRRPSGLGGSDPEDLPRGGSRLCVLQAVRDARNQARKKDWEALAEGLKRGYREEGGRGQGSAQETA